MKILVLSDPSDSARGFMDDLQQAGQGHRIFTDAWPAYSMTSLDNADLILLHVDNGVEHDELVHLRQETKVPILLIGTIEDEKTLVELFASGVDDHLVPPVSRALLSAKLRVWQRWVVRLASVLYH